MSQFINQHLLFMYSQYNKHRITMEPHRHLVSSIQYSRSNLMKLNRIMHNSIMHSNIILNIQRNSNPTIIMLLKDPLDPSFSGEIKGKSQILPQCP